MRGVFVPPGEGVAFAGRTGIDEALRHACGVWFRVVGATL
jgi:hypothetical protein